MTLPPGFRGFLDGLKNGEAIEGVSLAADGEAVGFIFIGNRCGTLALARPAGANRDTQLMIKVLLAMGIIGFCYRTANSSTRT